MTVATEWRSGHGGLSTFNRELCRALAELGHEVYCLVPVASREEIAEAAVLAVKLIAAPQQPGLPDEAKLLLRVPELQTVGVDIIIGHGRITGPAAQTQAQFFQGCRRLHFLHMDPGSIEWFKEQSMGDQTATKAEEREQLEIALAAKADLVVAVGPRLKRAYATLLHTRDIDVHEFLPGLPNLAPIERVAPGNRCLVIGRAEDHKLKGLDIAARAAGLLTDGVDTLRVQLVIRGVPRGQGTALRRKLVRASGVSDTDILPREYVADAERIDQDIRSSSVVLMPSRSEGFGLVALEALAAGVPILISDKSGLADVVKQIDPGLAAQHVIRVRDDLEEDARAWSSRIRDILTDCQAAVARARRLRDAFAGAHTWGASTSALLKRLSDLPTRTSVPPHLGNGATVKIELTLNQRPKMYIEQTVLMTQLANLLGAQVAAMHITELPPEDIGHPASEGAADEGNLPRPASNDPLTSEQPKDTASKGEGEQR